MRRFIPLVVASLALFLSACGADGPNAGGAKTAADEPSPVVSEPDRDQLYAANGMVCRARSSPNASKAPVTRWFFR